MMRPVSRRHAIAVTAVALPLTALTPTTDAGQTQSTAMAGPDIQIPQAVRTEKGDWLVAFRVIASDDFKPIANVEVEFNWWGTDGGVRIYRTNSQGILEFPETLSPLSANPFDRQQVYHLVLKPPKGSRFATCTHSITIHADGTYFPNQFSLPFYETTVEGMKYYAKDRPSIDRG